VKNLDKISNSKLFAGIDLEHLPHMLSCAGAEQKDFKSGETALFAGEKPSRIGVILTGYVHILRECPDGSNVLIKVLAQGEILAYALNCLSVTESPNTIVAKTATTILFFDFSRILGICPIACAHKQRLVENMLSYTASKNIELQNRLEIVSLKSVRKKILVYLSTLPKDDDNYITAPLNRQEMADFLCVERSALSHELSKMKKDNLIDYTKNHFLLKT